MKLTAAVLVLSIWTVRDTVTAQHRGQADRVGTLEMGRGTAVLRRKSSRYQGSTLFFVRLIGTVGLSVTPPALWDALEGVETLEVV